MVIEHVESTNLRNQLISELHLSNNQMLSSLKIHILWHNLNFANTQHFMMDVRARLGEQSESSKELHVLKS